MTSLENLDSNIKRAESDWPVAVIASAFRTGILAARDLEKRNVRVILIDCNPDIDGLKSVYGETILCPNPDTEPDAWFAFMRDLSAKLGGQPPLMPASDQFVTAIGQWHDQLASLYSLPATAKLQAELAVKEGQVRLSEEHGLPCPKTRYALSEEDVTEFAQIAMFPAVLKPRQHRHWSSAPIGHELHETKAVCVETPEELMRVYRLATGLSPGVVIQEFIDEPAESKRVYFCLYRHDGVQLSQFTLTELRDIEIAGATVCEPIDDPELVNVCDRFFESLGYRGTCEIEMVWDHRDNTPKVMDINPRFTGSGDALMYAGIDQAWMLYLDLIGKPVEPVSPPPHHFRHIMFLKDMLAIRQAREAGTLDWAKIRETYRSPVHFWDLDIRDWRLTAITIWRAIRLNVGTLVNPVIGRHKR